MKKILIAFLFFLTSIFFLSTKTYAYENNDLYEVYKENEYVKRDYSNYENNKIIGKKYRVGVMEHRQVMEFGEGRIIARELIRHTGNYTRGTLLSLKDTEYKQYYVEKEVMVSNKVKVGLTQMFEAAVNVSEIVKVGASTSWTVENETTYSCKYTKSQLTSTTREVTYNVSNFPSDKTTFRFSTVGIFIEFDVKQSYTEENRLNFFSYKWTAISNTKVTNYKISYCIDSVFTTVYNDNTFGNLDSGIFKLDSTIKEY